MAPTFAEMASEASQEDYVTDDWLTTNEGWAAQEEIWTRHSLIDELICRTADSNADEMLDHMPADYGQPNTQLMLV